VLAGAGVRTMTVAIASGPVRGGERSVDCLTSSTTINPKPVWSRTLAGARGGVKAGPRPPKAPPGGGMTERRKGRRDVMVTRGGGWGGLELCERKLWNDTSRYWTRDWGEGILGN